MSKLKRFALATAYNPGTGALTWKVKPSRNVKIGALAGTVKAEGYVRLKWGGDYEYAHRIVWLIMTGEEPLEEIDHRNGIRSDNRWKNLRPATRVLNSENRRRARSDSATGVLGAMPNKKGFMARIKAAGVMHYLGTFPTTEQAHAAYVKAKRQLHEGCTI